MTKIVITGGPCAGKSTLLSAVKDEISSFGYKVICVKETATELIEAGVSPAEYGSDSFQLLRMSLQLQREKIYGMAAEMAEGEKVLLVFDRGMQDSCAYTGKERFRRLSSELGLTEVQTRDSYDGVFHLETAAKGAPRSYTLSNNKARTESAEEAVRLDDAIACAWVGTPHYRVIEASEDFSLKKEKLLSEIKALLGIPKPLETERKYLIEYPDLQMLWSCPFCEKVLISQTYLENSEAEERVRKRGDGKSFLYFHTVKKKLCGAKREEYEEEISEEEYREYLKRADRERNTIDKTRYCLIYKGQYFEIDVYPFFSDRAVAELEMTDESREPRFPEWMKIIKEVTEDDSYKNSSLARKKEKQADGH